MPRNAATNRIPQQNYNAALSFAGGSGSVVSITDASDLRLATGFTVVARAYLNTRSGDNFKGIVSKGGVASGGERNYLLALNTTNTVLQCGYETVGGANQFASGNRTVPLNQWFMPGVTWDGANVQCYQNGTVDGSAFAATGTPCMTAADLEIGRNQNTAQEWGGLISDVMLWNRALTAQEMSDLYLKGVIPTSGLVDRWRLDEGAGGTANSQTGTHNGTVTSAVWTGNTPSKARKAINGNKVVNGDFEYAPPFTAATTTSARYIDGTAGGSTTNDLFGWFFTIGSGFTGSAQFDTSVKRSGTASLKLVSTVGNGASTVGLAASQTAASGPTVAQQNQYLFRISPNTDYVLTAYIKTDSIVTNDGNGARIRAVQYGGVTTSNTGTSEGNNITGTNDWSVSTVRFTSGSSSRFIQVIPVIYGDTTGTAWFDDITLTPVYPEGRVPANGNLVKNFDFEVVPTFVAATTTSNRWIDGTAGGSTSNSTYKWGLNFTNSSSSGISCQFDTSVSHLGSGSMKLSLTATNKQIAVSNALSNSVLTVRAQSIPINPSTSYTYSFWMKTNYVSGDSNDGAFLQLTDRNNASGTGIQSVTSTKIKTTTDWTFYTGTITTSATANCLDVLLFISGTTGTATLIMDAWFDDIYLAPTTNPGRVAIT